MLYTARFNQTAGYIYWHASEYEKAAGYLEEAVKLSEKYGTLNVELNALTKLAVTLSLRSASTARRTLAFKAGLHHQGERCRC